MIVFNPPERRRWDAVVILPSFLKWERGVVEPPRIEAEGRLEGLQTPPKQIDHRFDQRNTEQTYRGGGARSAHPPFVCPSGAGDYTTVFIQCFE